MSVSTLRRGLLAAAVVAVLAGPAASPAVASTITVNTTSDTLVTDGSCSIREAIINANDDAATWPDCAAGSGADTIILPAGTITLAIPNPVTSPCCLDSDQVSAWGDLDIGSSMTIVGDPAGTIIDGNALDRIFDVNPDTDELPETVTPSITVSISALTITNGRQNQSGAVRINARATVAMDRCTVSNSNAWADDGGGIFLFADGALTLTNSTISGNQALIMGAGVRGDGTLSIVNSTITGNSTGPVFANLAQGLI
jgi:CSLREA domain-containing protein